MKMEDSTSINVNFIFKTQCQQFDLNDPSINDSNVNHLISQNFYLHIFFLKRQNAKYKEIIKTIFRIQNFSEGGLIRVLAHQAVLKSYGKNAFIAI